jgi:uncharacterized protein YjlB
VESVTNTKNISLAVYTDAKTGNASLKNLVRENCTQGSVRGDIFNETKFKLILDLRSKSYVSTN